MLLGEVSGRCFSPSKNRSRICLEFDQASCVLNRLSFKSVSGGPTGDPSDAQTEVEHLWGKEGQAPDGRDIFLTAFFSHASSVLLPKR